MFSFSLPDSRLPEYLQFLFFSRQRKVAIKFAFFLVLRSQFFHHLCFAEFLQAFLFLNTSQLNTLLNISMYSTFLSNSNKQIIQLLKYPSQAWNFLWKNCTERNCLMLFISRQEISFFISGPKSLYSMQSASSKIKYFSYLRPFFSSSMISMSLPGGAHNTSQTCNVCIRKEGNTILGSGTQETDILLWFYPYIVLETEIIIFTFLTMKERLGRLGNLSNKWQRQEFN